MPQKISPHWESQTSYPHRRRSTRMQRFGPIRPRSLYRRNLRFAHYFYKQLRDQGLLLVVIKTEAGGDHLFLLRKTVDHFESLWSAPCGFVQLRGSYQFEDLEPNTLDKAYRHGASFRIGKSVRDASGGMQEENPLKLGLPLASAPF
jgi:hypothetical protein